MAALLRRLTLLGKVWLNALLAPAADPRQTFTNAFQRQRELLVKVQLALGAIATSKAQLQAKTVLVREKLPQLDEQARRALIAGREDLARLALQRHQVAVVELQALEEQVNEVQREESSLALVEHRLAAQIEAFHARQEVIAARYSAAEAQVQINEALGGVSQELADLGIALEQAEIKTEHMQARASALDHLVEAGVLDLPGLAPGSSIERQLTQIDVAQAVEDQLAALKQQLGAAQS